MFKKVHHLMRRSALFFLRLTLYFWGLIVLLIGIPYIICPVYRFPEFEPFSGPALYNPYASQSPCWFKANFHCHSKSWKGMTSGKNTIREIYDHYRRLDYDCIALSNYQHISPPGNDPIHTIGVYEHGYSVWKRHHIVIGAQRVEWFDFLLWQSPHQKQFILNRLKGSGFIAIAHPRFSGSYSIEDMTLLTGHHAVEVFNSYRDSPDHWDAALTAGYPVWLLGSDDSHDLANTRQTASRWNMINASSTEPDSLLSAMKKGNYYAVVGRHGHMDNHLVSAEVNDTAYQVQFESPLNSLVFIGSHGDTLDCYYGTAGASVPVDADRPYIRVAAQSDSCRFYLNPIIRYDGRSLPAYKAVLHWPKTGLKAFMTLASLFLIAGAYTVFQRKRRS